MATWTVPYALWQGGDVWILGGGPSVVKQFNIPEEIVNEVRMGASPSLYSPYMKAIHDKHVIGINVAYTIGDWLDMVFFGDSGFFLRHEKALYAWPNLKVSCAPASSKHNWVKFLDRNGNKPHGISDNPRKVSWNGNSGAAAISVAASAGAKRIFLLGFDMKLDEEGKNQHWHTLYKSKPTDPIKPISLPFHKHIVGFPAIAKDARAMGIEIINVSPNSAIKDFKKVSLNSILEL